MENLEKTLAKILESVLALDKKVDGNAKDLNEKLEENAKDLNKKLEENAKDLNKNLEETAKDLNKKLEETAKDLNKKLDSTNEKLDGLQRNQGYLFERNARSIIAEKYGKKYAESFLIQNPYGLARLAWPKKACFPLPSNYEHLDDTTILNKNARCLLDYFYAKKLYFFAEEKSYESLIHLLQNQKPDIVGLVSDCQTTHPQSINNAQDHVTCMKKLINALRPLKLERFSKISRICDGLASLAQFYSEPKNNRENYLLSDEGPVVFCFTALHTDYPQTNLEFDCRGNVSLTIDNSKPKVIITIHCGEIKMSYANGKAKAKKQLKLRLQVLKDCSTIICQSVFPNYVPVILLHGHTFHGSPSQTSSLMDNGISLVSEKI